MSGSGSGNSSVGNRQIYQADDKMASPGDKEVIIDPVEQMQKDPTYPAKSHGNEPSKGAKIDAEIMQDEQEELRKKGKA